MEKSTVQRLTMEEIKVTVEFTKSIEDYNQNLGENDLFDHSCYSSVRKSQKCW